MEDKEKKSKLKEVLKAAGVAGAGAAIGAAALPTNYLDRPIWELANSKTSLGEYLKPIVVDEFPRLGGLTIVNSQPRIGARLNAAVSGLGALAAYGLLKGGSKAIKSLVDKSKEKSDGK